jgi:hypothetical protein
MQETKAFWRSSEFYVTIGVILTAISGAFSSNHRVQGIIVAAAGVAYTISRGIAKSGSPYIDPKVAEVYPDPAEHIAQFDEPAPEPKPKRAPAKRGKAGEAKAPLGLKGS